MSDSKIDLHSRASDATTAAQLTGVGRSAIAVIAVVGPRSAEVIADCFAAATNRDYQPGQIRYGNWRGNAVLHGESRTNGGDQDISVGAAESVVVLPISDQEFEIHCHGGVAATDRILDDLRHHGVNIVTWNGDQWQHSEPTLIRESKLILSRCLTTRTAAVALDQVRGAMLNWCQQALGGELSFETVDQQAREILAFSALGMRLNDRFRVVLAGPPNVGKSSLINAMVGYDRSITLDQPGTTRDVLHAETAIDGLAIQLSDTAGIREGEGEIEKEGIRKANLAVSQADVVIWVTTPEQQNLAGMEDHSPLKLDNSIRVMNKADLLVDQELPSGVLQTVATTGQGVNELMAAISQTLVPIVAPPGSAVPIHQRQNDALEKIVVAKDRDAQRQAIAELIGRQAID